MIQFFTSQEIFHPSRKNPNGCPIAATFYVSHEWTDYGLVQSLYSGGNLSLMNTKKTTPCLSR